MEKRYIDSRNRCIEKVLSFFGEGTLDGVPEEIKPRIMDIVRFVSAAAFSDGYESGYTNGVDDSKDIG